MSNLSENTRVAVIQALIEKMNAYYVMPEKATLFEAAILKKLDDGIYDSHDDVHGFASALTAELQAVVGDRHLGVGYSPEMFEQILKYEQNPDAYQPDEEEERRVREQARYDNNGFKRIERLTGNVGYIQLNMFVDTTLAGDTAVAAMNFVSNCDALIFDLRQNGGGWPSMIQLLSSYLFDESTHLNNFYDRPDDTTTQFWTLPYVPGKTMSSVPVYVLISNRTFSAAEEFTYNLKNLKRATIVGETTGGGGHPVTGMTLTEGFTARICRARAVNPNTNTNWEGVGVVPDIDVPQAEALAKAHLHAMETLLENSTSTSETHKRQWELDNLQALYNPLVLDDLQQLAGRYGHYGISVENNQLAYTMRGFPGKLAAISAQRFVDLERDSVHLEFVQSDEGAMSLKVVFRDNARQMSFPRNAG